MPLDLLILAASIRNQPCAQTCFRQRQHRGHQERGPIDSVETNDVFADEMHIGGPHAALFVIRAADGAEIGGERVEPDVEDVRLFAGHGNAPADGGARDA